MRSHLFIVTICAALLAVPAFSQDVRNTYIAVAAQIAANVVTNAKLATMADSTIKGSAVGAGTSTPTDLTAAQAAAIVGSVGGALKSKIITSTRDLTTASGSQALTGMGFQPTSCFTAGGLGSSQTIYTTIFGMSDSSKTVFGSFLSSAASTLTGSLFMRYSDTTGANTQEVTISSYDADGLTLSWVKTGTPTGTVTFGIICFR